MPSESLQSPGILLTIPPSVSALRVRYEGGGGRGRIALEFCNRRASRITADMDLDRPRLEEAAQRLLDAWCPGWAGGRAGSGSLLIDLTTGEARIESEAVA